MKRMRAVLLPSVFLLFASASVAGEPELASSLDYTLNESRDKPVVCKEGDLERFPGQTLAQVFGEKWPVQPQPQVGSERIHAQMLQVNLNRAVLKGMPAQRGLVVFAVLVDASGKPLQAEVLCATTSGYDKVTQRVAMQSNYRPAVINGKSVTSVVVHVQKYAGGGT